MNAETTPRLGTLPVAFPATVAALHRVAEHVIAPARKPDTGIYPGHPIIQVDFDQMQLGKFDPVEVPVEVWQTSLHNPDFSAFARNCGSLGIRMTDIAALDAGLAEAVAHDGPAMVEVITDPNLI